MRQRSKSLYVEHKPIYDDEDEDEEIGFMQSPNGWSLNDDMTLIRLIWQQLPKNEELPYYETLNKVKWNKICFDKRSPQELQHRFSEILKGYRTFRYLDEILKDIQKDLMKAELPKKLLPFSIYIGENKELIKKKQNSTSENYIQCAANLFRNLPEEEREVYKQKSNNMKKEYNDIVSKYGLDVKLKSKSNSPQKVKKSTPFLNYLEWKKQNDPTAKYTEIKKQFTKLDKERKLQWILEWLGVQQGHKLNLEQYNLAKSQLSKEEMNMIDEYEGRPKKLHAYQIYVKKYLEIHRGEENIDNTVLFKTIGEKWKNSTLEEKQAYEELAKKSKFTYEEELRKFMNSLPQDRRFAELERLKRTNRSKSNSKDVASKSETNDELPVKEKTKEGKKKKSKNSIGEIKQSDEEDKDDDFVPLNQEGRLNKLKQQKEQKKNKTQNNVSNKDPLKKNNGESITKGVKKVKSDEIYTSSSDEEGESSAQEIPSYSGKKGKISKKDELPSKKAKKNSETTAENFAKKIGSSLGKKQQNLKKETPLTKIKNNSKPTTLISNEKNTAETKLAGIGILPPKLPGQKEMCTSSDEEGESSAQKTDSYPGKKRKISKKDELPSKKAKKNSESTAENFSKEAENSLGKKQRNLTKETPLKKIKNNSKSTTLISNEKNTAETKSAEIGILSPKLPSQKEMCKSSDEELESCAKEAEKSLKKKQKDSKKEMPSKKIKNDSESSTFTSNEVNSKKQEKSKSHVEILKALVKPPSSVYKYFVLNEYKGPMSKAKFAYKNLSINKKNKIKKKYEALSEKFLKDFKQFAKDLRPEEIAELSEKFKNSQDDEISDITESESESESEESD